MSDKGQDVRGQQELLAAWVSRLGYESLVYSEVGVNGAKTTRPALDQLMDSVRLRQVRAVAVLKLDRLGRSLEHLLQLLGEFDANGVRLLVHDMAIDTATPQGWLFFSMVGAFAEFERCLIAEQVREDMAYTKAHGTRSGHPVGRKPADVPFMTICDAILRVREGRARCGMWRWSWGSAGRWSTSG